VPIIDAQDARDLDSLLQRFFDSNPTERPQLLRQLFTQKFDFNPATGKEEECSQNILAAFKELLNSLEIHKVINSYKYLNEWADKAKQAADEIVLLGYLPGNCRICQRLGM